MAYPDELKSHVISEYRSGRSMSELARDFEPCYGTICDWVKEADLHGTQPSESSQDELKRLRRENRELREDKAILEKAAAWFAKHH